ncbi:hypothetical protein QOZ80_1BG0063460 [Eleusine coracana subsp. coracana]|nr:hypothetical protein QOZ80_1BG0063460 [Eleusine coracana subsp. coracana]
MMRATMAMCCCLADFRLVAVLHLLVVVARSQVAVATNNLTSGDTLTPPSYITSPSGVFAFGFRALDSDPTKFLLATWFRSGSGNFSPAPPPQSVVWFAKQSPSGATPLSTTESVLSVTSDGVLALTDAGNRPLWNASSTKQQQGSVVLALADSGNLRLLGDDGVTVLWESFWYPTDTLLPGQSLTLDDRSQGKLFSKRADAEFTATGRFSMGIQADGNVVLYVDLPSGNNSNNAYWQAYSNSPDGSNTTVTFDDRGRLSYTLHNGTVHSLITTSSSAPGAYFQFARMDPDGVVRIYARSRNNNNSSSSSWLVSGAFPDDGCNKRTSGLQGMCGPGSFCVETTDRLQCECPTGYNYTDTQHNDSGCAPAFEPQTCDGEKDGGSFALVELQNVTWEASIYYKKLSSVTEDECRANCLADCFCAAALVSNSECVELAALTNGRRAKDVTTRALIKVRSSPRTIRTTTRSSPYKILTVCLAALLAITVGGLLAQRYYLIRNRKNRGGETQRLLSVRAFTWKELHQATNGFEKLLGKGSFGEVYQGTIRSSPHPRLVAVKKLLDANAYTDTEFANEVQCVGQIHHRNLVRMLGYCKEGRHRMLVFEFMPGGSLRAALFDDDVERRPPWPWRAEAALAIARGLEYLHDGCSVPIIHCDIKPDNILLDGRGVPRITDFGISKLLGSHQVHATVTNVRGTRGYIAPEWLRGDARVDTRADVYSFGVVLLEMICCRRCQEPVAGADHDNDETVTLFGWAAQLVSARRTDLMLLDIVDAAEDLERVERFARVALWCIEPNPALRPTMHQVVHMLETSDQVQLQEIPDPPGCYMESSPLLPSPMNK